MKKQLEATVRIGGLRHIFTAEDLDPINAPSLAQTKETIRAMLVAWANDPKGLDAEFDQLVAQARKDFAKVMPELRTRYAIALEPQTEH